jgi:putative aldouronate transport system permease protein
MNQMVLKNRNGWRRAVRTFRKNSQLLLLCIPSLVFTLLFHYIPIFGIILPFKQYRYVDGIFGSKWVGLKNFRVFFNTPDLARLVRNTVGYSLWFMIIGTVMNVLVALMLYELAGKKLKKLYQTAIMIPNFLSIVMVGYITYAILNPSAGLFNQLLNNLGFSSIDVYSNPAYWPFILTIVSRWQGMNGYLIYYANLMSIDPLLFEAAAIDGATRGQMRRYISIPSLVPLLCMMTILSIGDLVSGDFGLFYQIPRNVGALYETTDIINTYVFRGLKSGNFTLSSAVGLMQSVISLILILVTNLIVRKVSPENSLF